MMQQLLHNIYTLSIVLVLIGLLALFIARSAGAGGFSWSLSRQGRLAQWSHARKIGSIEERRLRAFKSHGTVTNVRNHPEPATNLFFNGLSGYTELETTQGALLVDDLVGPISRGLAVYVNQKGQVRIGGLYSRTFELCREVPPAPAARELQDAGVGHNNLP